MTVTSKPHIVGELPTARRHPTARDYVMCRPEYFAVQYSINVWMDLQQPIDRRRALRQWEALRATYERLGHRVYTLDPQPGLPDMVFTANAAFVVGDQALAARFRDPVRAPEVPAHRKWLARAGISVYEPTAINEGEGDFVWAGNRILAGSGFRSDPASHKELAALFDVPIVSLELVDPRFYHLDTALTFLDVDTIAYYPAAFTPDGLQTLITLYPNAIVADETGALTFGLNAVSDGCHVVVAEQAEHLINELAAAEFEPVPVDVSELLKAGGGVKCSTMELHRPAVARLPAVHPTDEEQP